MAANIVARALVLVLRIYQRTLSPLLGPVCRFEPSCSAYSIACFERFGALRGLWLTARRLLRCHPFHPGGYDPPPLGVVSPASGPGADPTEREKHPDPC